MSTALDQLNTPDVTKADVIAVGQAAIAVAIAFGVPLSVTQQSALLGLAGGIAVVLTAADTLRRRGRLKFLTDSFGVDLPPPQIDLGALAVLVAHELAGEAAPAAAATPVRATSIAEAVHRSEETAAAAAAANDPDPPPPGTYPVPGAELTPAPELDTAAP